MVTYRQAHVRQDQLIADNADPHAIAVTQQANHLSTQLNDSLDPFWGGGTISLSPYETAWVALVRHPIRTDRLAFPAALHWLVCHQHVDGHWGDPFPHALLPTLAGLLACRQCPQPTARTRAASARAYAYLLQHLPTWDVTTFDTPLFELLVPAVLTELDDAALVEAAPGLDLMAERTRLKLDHVPLELVYQKQSPLIHGLEALGRRLDFARIGACQSPDGSFGNSPAATAAVLIYGPCWNVQAAAWLHHLLRRQNATERGGMPTSHPADVFEVAWVGHFLQHGGYRLSLTKAAPKHLLDWLRESLTEQGVGFARWGGLPPDVDDTAVTLAVLRRAGMHVPLDALWHFAEGDHFVNYPGERTASSSANAHVLDALLTAPEPIAAGCDRLSRYLLEQRSSAGNWQDKWHLSPYYATLACVLALARMPGERWRRELVPTLRWLLDTCQGEGWGMQAATVEETAYAVLSLAVMAESVPASLHLRWRRALQVNRRFLARQSTSLDSICLPSMWLDKTLYHSRPVILAAAMSALLAARAALTGREAE